MLWSISKDNELSKDELYINIRLSRMLYLCYWEQLQLDLDYNRSVHRSTLNLILFSL